jgi:hypothetical protein
MYTKNLDGWEKTHRTQSCMLSGSYFNRVFADYPGLLRNPLNIRIRQGRNGVRRYAHMEQNSINKDYPGLLRVNIEANNFRHSNLLILDYANGIAHRFEPLGRNAPYFQEVTDAIDDYLNAFFDFDIEVIDANVADDKNEKCDNSGFCAAYVILYAYSYLNGKDYDCRDIRRFAAKIEQVYGKIPTHEQEVQYGNTNDNRGQKMGIGTAAGLGVGLLVGAPLLGAAAGLGAGSIF